MDWYNRCACGAIRYEIVAEPVMAGHCQCRDCQRDSGTGHASHIAFARDAAQLSGQASHWDKPAESGKVVTRALCPTCGSPVYSTNTGIPELFLAVPRALTTQADTRRKWWYGLRAVTLG